MVERAGGDPGRPASARPRHRGERPGAAPGRAAPRRAGHPLVADRGRGAEPRPRGPGVRPTGPTAPALAHPGQRARSSSVARPAIVAARRRHRPAGHRQPRRTALMLELRGVAYRYPGYAQDGPRRHRPRRSATARSSGSSGRTRPASRRCASSRPGLAPASIGGKLTGTLTIDGEPMADRKTHELAERVVHRLPEPEHPALRDRGDRLRGDRARPDEPGPRRCPEIVERTREAIALLRLEAIMRAPPDTPLRRPGAARRDRVASRDAAGPRHPRRADGPARSGRHAAGRRGAPAARGARDVAAARRAQDGPARRPLLRGSS